jgi:hypothetical protein
MSSPGANKCHHPAPINVITRLVRVIQKHSQEI